MKYFPILKVIESDEYFFTLGDDIDDAHRESIYSHPSGARNVPFQTWTFEDAVRTSLAITPEEFDKINPFENNAGITWEKFEAFSEPFVMPMKLAKVCAI